MIFSQSSDWRSLGSSALRQRERRTSLGRMRSGPLPMQVRPSAWSRYPARHWHWKKPWVLTQPCWQPPFSTSHSSTSAEGRDTVKKGLQESPAQADPGSPAWLIHNAARVLGLGCCLLHFGSRAKKSGILWYFSKFLQALPL